jgi:hypothetical protein
MGSKSDISDETARTDRRRFVQLVGALGVTGLAGCSGDDENTRTDTQGGNGNGNGDMTDTPTETGGNGNGETPTDTDTPETDTPTETPDTGESLGEQPAPLISPEEATVPAGETKTFSTSLLNPYLFDLQNVEITPEAPNDDWTVSLTGETNLGTVDISASREITWEVTAPESASGDYIISFNVTYESATDQADLTVEQSVSVFTPGDVPENGLIAHFPLDDSPPENAAGGSTGTVEGDPVTDAKGFVGSAYEFDGEDDYVSLPEFGSGTSSITLSMWVNTETWGDSDSFTQLLFLGGPVPDHTGLEVWIPSEVTTPELLYWNGESASPLATAESTPQTGEWVHLCGVYDDESGTGTIYIDGAASGSASVQANIDLDPVDNTLAAHPQGEPAERFFQGRIDELRVYDRALSQGEVLSIANQ